MLIQMYTVLAASTCDYFDYILVMCNTIYIVKGQKLLTNMLIDGAWISQAIQIIAGLSFHWNTIAGLEHPSIENVFFNIFTSYIIS